MKGRTHKNTRFLALILLPAILAAAILFATTQPAINAQAQAIPSSQTSATSTTSPNNLADDDLMNYIIQSGIAVPSDLLDLPVFQRDIKRIIYSTTKSRPNLRLTQHQIDNIQTLIYNYQGLPQKEFINGQSYSLSSFATRYTLEDNLVLHNGQWQSTGGDWNDSYINYNCYSYAIGKTDIFRDPGQHSGVTDYNMWDYTISQMANFVHKR